MRENKQKILKAFLQCPRGSDHKIAKIVGVAQPTVTRVRSAIEAEQLLNFQCVPDFYKLDYNIAVVIEAKFAVGSEGKQFCIDAPEVLMAVEGLTSLVLFTVHKDYGAFSGFMDRLKSCKPVLGNVNVVDTKYGIVKPFSTTSVVI